MRQYSRAKQTLRLGWPWQQHSAGPALLGGCSLRHQTAGGIRTEPAWATGTLQDAQETHSTPATHTDRQFTYTDLYYSWICVMSRIDQPVGLWWHDGGCDTNIIDKWKRSNRNHLTWLWMHKVIEWVGWSIGKYHLIQLNNVVWWLKHKTSLGPNYICY